MQMTYSLDATTIEVSQSEMTTHRAALRRARRSEEYKGRRVTVLVRLEVHEASEKQVELSPNSRLFPRPICALGALVPVVIADKLREYAKNREQPLSDLTRILWAEFLIAKDRREREDGWAMFIENRLNEVHDLRSSKKKISYARTKQMRVKNKRSTPSKKRVTKKTSKKKVKK